jgi:aspartate kinase
MRILKFGGSLLRTGNDFNYLMKIVDSNESPFILVISAFSDTTRKLRKAAALAEDSNESEALALIHQIIAKCKSFLQQYAINKESYESAIGAVDGIEMLLERLIRGVAITRDLSGRTLDLILCQGEMLALCVTDFILRTQYDSFSTIDSSKLIITDSNFGAAEPIIEETCRNISKVVKDEAVNAKFVLTQGFTANNGKGEATTMGMESSNLTAMLFAQALDASELVFYTDVQGICSADPNFVAEAKLIPHLSIAQANLAARLGLKLIHPRLFDYFKDSDLKVYYKSAYNDNGEYTVITKKTQDYEGFLITSENISSNYNQNKNKGRVIDSNSLILNELTSVISVVFLVPCQVAKVLSFISGKLNVIKKIEVNTSDSGSNYIVKLEVSDESTIEFVRNLHNLLSN